MKEKKIGDSGLRVSTMQRSLTFIIPAVFDGKKLIAFLRGQVGVSVRTLAKLKADPLGLLRNGEHIRTIDLLHTGDRIEVRLPAENGGIAPASFEGLDIVFEDADVLLINKPGNLAVHPTHNHQGDTLANQVAGYLEQKGSGAVFRAVGRLDKTTSGLVLCALNKHAAFRLSGAYEKEYLAIAEGALTGSGTIDTPIYRPDPGKTLRAAGPEGDPAVTHWQALASNGSLTLLRIRLETGRTHQIRVHMASIGCPLAGDEMYGGSRKYIGRAALHCETVRFVHPVNGKAMAFTVSPPEDMRQLINMINN